VVAEYLLSGLPDDGVLGWQGAVDSLLSRKTTQNASIQKGWHVILPRNTRILLSLFSSGSALVSDLAGGASSALSMLGYLFELML
jgi:hypothetical protein